MFICETCKKEFEGNRGKVNRFCSAPCYNQWQKGKKSKYPQGLMGGRGWNKGIVGEASHLSGNDWGFQKTAPDSLYNQSRSKYIQLHKRWYKLAGKATKCERCGSEKNAQWHNLSGKYIMETSDWMQICAKCHFEIDNRRAGK